VAGWFNPNAGDKQPCPVLVAVGQLREAIAELHNQLDTERQRVHASAHDHEAMMHVASALLAGTPLAELDPETRAGWLHVAQLGTEALAAYLDPAVNTQPATTGATS
jgi:hypothetical protein